jgi:hypothetical protein
LFFCALGFLTLGVLLCVLFLLAVSARLAFYACFAAPQYYFLVNHIIPHIISLSIKNIAFFRDFGMIKEAERISAESVLGGEQHGSPGQPGSETATD